MNTIGIKGHLKTCMNIINKTSEQKDLSRRLSRVPRETSLTKKRTSIQSQMTKKGTDL